MAWYWIVLLTVWGIGSVLGCAAGIFFGCMAVGVATETSRTTLFSKVCFIAMVGVVGLLLWPMYVFYFVKEFLPK